MKYSIYINSVNASKYVTGLGSVPVLSRNEDYSLVVEGYTFQISNQTTTPVKGQSVLFYREDELLHNGFIKKVSFDEDTLLYSVEVSHILEKLKEYNTNSDFETLLLARDTIKSINDHDHQVIHHSNVISAIFDSLNLDLDWSLYVEKNDYATTGYTHDGDIYNYTYLFTGVPTFGESDIFFLPNQLLCINQAKVWHPSYLETPEGEQNRVALFDLLSILFSMTGYTAIPKSETEFYILNVKTAYTIDDDNIKQINEEELEPQADGLNSQVSTCNMHRGKVSFTTIPPHVNPYFFPYSANQVYYYDITAVYNGDPNDLTTYVYNVGTVHGDSSPVAWFDHLIPIVLDPHDGTHTYYLIPPVFNTSFPMLFVERSKRLTATKVEMTIDAEVVFPITKNYARLIKISDINNDLAEMELFVQ